MSGKDSDLGDPGAPSMAIALGLTLGVVLLAAFGILA